MPPGKLTYTPTSGFLCNGSSNRNHGAVVGGVHGGGRTRQQINGQQRRSFSCLWRGGRFAEADTYTRFSSRPHGCSNTPCTRVSAASSSTAAAGASSAGAGGGGGGGDKEGGGSPGALSAVTLRSLRTARDRGDVKYKPRKQKPVKTEPSPSVSSSSSSSSAAAAPGTNGGGGGDLRGGQRLLRLSKLLADRAIGTRSEVRNVAAAARM